jgi:hypothetical protein
LVVAIAVKVAKAVAESRQQDWKVQVEVNRGPGAKVVACEQWKNSQEVELDWKELKVVE